MNLDKTPEISVLMPLYNAENYVEESIRSVLSQTFQSFELIIIDDCSMDRSYEKAKRLSENDGRIRLYKNEKNEGVVASRNKLIELSIGKYIAILDSDDVSMPERLSTQLDFLEKNPDVGLLGTNAFIIDGEGGKKGLWKHPSDPDKLAVEMVFHSPFISSSVMIRKNAVSGIFYDTDYPVAEDFDLYSRISINWKTANLDAPLVKYRLNQSGLSSKNSKQMEELTTSVIKKYLAVKGLDVDDDIISRYRKIFSAETINFRQLCEIESSLIHLRKKMIEMGIFNNIAVKDVFQNKWYEVCIKSTSSGISAYKTFLNSELYSGNIDLKGKLRLFVKSLFKAE